MKKSIVIGLIALVALATGFSMVSAATAPQGNGPYANRPALTEAQQQEMAPLLTQMNDLRKQMFEVRKQMIQKQVSFGNLTQEQADWRIGKMKERAERIGNVPGQGGKGFMGGGRGPGQQQSPAK